MCVTGIALLLPLLPVLKCRHHDTYRNSNRLTVTQLTASALDVEKLDLCIVFKRHLKPLAELNIVEFVNLKHIAMILSNYIPICFFKDVKYLKKCSNLSVIRTRIAKQMPDSSWTKNSQIKK